MPREACSTKHGLPHTWCTPHQVVWHTVPGPFPLPCQEELTHLTRTKPTGPAAPRIRPHRVVNTKSHLDVFVIHTELQT